MFNLISIFDIVVLYTSKKFPYILYNKWSESLINVLVLLCSVEFVRINIVLLVWIAIRLVSTNFRNSLKCSTAFGKSILNAVHCTRQRALKFTAELAPQKFYYAISCGENGDRISLKMWGQPLIIKGGRN